MSGRLVIVPWMRIVGTTIRGSTSVLRMGTATRAKPNPVSPRRNPARSTASPPTIRSVGLSSIVHEGIRSDTAERILDARGRQSSAMSLNNQPYMRWMTAYASMLGETLA
jgi:hypothetical protein